jgi:hypothetical protein
LEFHLNEIVMWCILTPKLLSLYGSMPHDSMLSTVHAAQ